MANDMANAPAQPAAQVQPLADLPVQSTKKCRWRSRQQNSVPAVGGAAAGSRSKNKCSSRWRSCCRPRQQHNRLSCRLRQQTVFQPLAELLPAQAATELVQPGPGAALAECSSRRGCRGRGCPCHRHRRRRRRGRCRHSVRSPARPETSPRPRHNTSKRSRTRIRTRIRIQKTSVQPLAELQHQWSRLQPLAENQTVQMIPTVIGDGVNGVQHAHDERACAQRHRQTHRQPRWPCKSLAAYRAYPISPAVFCLASTTS